MATSVLGPAGRADSQVLINFVKNQSAVLSRLTALVGLVNESDTEPPGLF